jgi:hypothetical protein
MCSRRLPLVAPSKKSRSAVTNRSRQHQNADERSAGARRFRDLIAAYTAEVGADLSESELALVRQAAALTMRAEQMQQAIVRGEVVDDDLLVRISGTAKRLLGAIAVRSQVKKPSGSDLQTYLANRQAAAEQSDEIEDD